MAEVTTLPITGVTASDSSAFGGPSVSNVAQGSFAQGFRAEAVGVLSLGLSTTAIDLSFDFTENYESLTGQVRICFSGPIVQPSITLGDCSGFGQFGIANAAQATNTVGGIKQEAYGIPAAFYANTAHALNLNFVTSLEIVTGDYVPFFTGPRPIAPESFESLVFGEVKIDSPIDAKPFGFDTSSFGLGMVVNVGEGLLNINFEKNTDKTDSISLRLDFGTGTRPIVPFGIDAPVPGAESELINTADALYLKGILSTAYGMATIAPSDSAHSFDLNFQRNLVEQNPLNVPFYFAERGSIKPYAIYPEGFGEHKLDTRDIVVFGVGGITPTEAYGVPYFYGTQIIEHRGFLGANISLGIPWVSNFTHRVYPQGFINKSAVGSPGVKWPYPQTTAPGSLVPLEFGTAFVDQTIRRITLTAGITTYAVGNPRVWFYVRDIYVSGGDYLRIGHPQAAHDVIVLPVSRTLEIPGTDVAAYGRAKIESTFKTVYPDSLSIPRFPTPGVEEYDARTFVYVNGMSTYMVTTPQIKQPYQLIGSKFLGDPQPSTQVGDQTVFGFHKFDWYTRYLAASGRVSSVVSTKHEIRDRAFYVQAVPATHGEFFGAGDFSHEVRTLRFTGMLVTDYGRPQLRLEKASIYPGFIFAFSSGQHTVGDGVRGLKVGGLPSSEAVGGRLRIEHYARAVFSTSWLSASFSPYSYVRDARQSIAVSSVPFPEFLVNSIISNRNAYIQVHFYAPSGVEVALFGNPFVRDRASRLLPSSIDRLRFGLATSVDYYIGDIAYVCISNVTGFGTTVVGHRIRWVYPEGFLSEVVSQRVHSRNTAMLLRGAGFGSVRLGMGSVFNLNRTVRVSSVPIWSSVSYGGFVAPRVRELSVFGVRPTTYIPQTHWVSNGLRAIKPQGMFGNTISARWETEVFERFNRVRPYWSTPLRPLFGEALVVLRNKTVHPYGYEYFESGRARASLYNRVLLGLTLGSTQLFGRLTIRDKRTEVRLSGASIANTFVSPSLTIRNLLPDPPWARELLIAAYTHANRVSAPWVRGNTLYPSSVYGGSAFSSPSVRCNTVTVYTGISEYNWGSTVVAGPRYLSVGTFNEVLVGRPRMSPYNIYAPEGSEEPADYCAEQETGIDNHVVDYYSGAFKTSDKNSTAWIPQPRVDYFHRKIAAIGVGVVWPSPVNPRPIGVRNAEIPKERQFVQLRGSSYLRVGWMTLSPFPQKALLAGIGSSGVGQPQLRCTELFIHYIRPASVNTSAAGVLWASLYNRNIQGRGADVSIYGNPIVWFAKRYIYPSGVMSRVELSNNAWVSNRIRVIAPLGEDMFNPEVAFYKNTTKVQNQYQGAVLGAKGFGSSSFGGLDVGLFRKYVRHAGGIFPVPANRVRVKSRSTLSAQGFEASSFGNVRKWEDNLIQVHEYQEPSAGMPVVSTPRQVQGFVSSVVDYPIIAAHIGPQGIEPEDVGATVLKNEICCGDCG